MKPADHQEDGTLVWHITRDTVLRAGEGYWQLESTILDCRHNRLGAFTQRLTNEQAEAILEQLTRAYEKAKRKSFFDLEGFGFPEGEYLLDIAKVEMRRSAGSGIPRLQIHNTIITGPEDSVEFEGESVISAYSLHSEKSWPFIQRLFKACGVPLTDGEVNMPLEQLARRAKQLPGKRYMATLARIGDDRRYVSVRNERPYRAPEGPYR